MTPIGFVVPVEMVDISDDPIAVIVHRLAVGYYNVPEVAGLLRDATCRVDAEAGRRARAIAEVLRVLVRGEG